MSFADHSGSLRQTSSNSATVPFGGGDEITIEDSADRSDKRPPAIRYNERTAIARYEAVCLERCQFAELGREAARIKAWAISERIKVDAKIAHQPLDDLTTQAIVVRQRRAARDGEAAGRHSVAPFEGLSEVLHVAATLPSN